MTVADPRSVKALLAAITPDGAQLKSFRVSANGEVQAEFYERQAVAAAGRGKEPDPADEPREAADMIGREIHGTYDPPTADETESA